MTPRRPLLAAWLVHAAIAFAPQHSRIPLRPSSPAVANVLSLPRSGLKSPSTVPVRTSSSAVALFGFGGLEFANLVYDSTATAFDAWEWTANIGAPAALVAGAVLVTLSETREASMPRKSDKTKVRWLKQSMRFLLLTSFALEVLSIFVSTMTGSVLLGHGEQKVASKLVGYMSGLQLMRHHHEFEYLTIQICFLQGLFNWLLAVAIELVLPKDKETKSARRMNKCCAGWLLSMIVWMLAFYNNHLSFYSDYPTMLARFLVLFFKRFVFCWPLRPLSFFYGPSFLYSGLLTWKAFKSPPEQDD